MRDRLVNRALNPLLADLPAKFEQILEYQIPVIADIVKAFDAGERVVVLDAPTGSGKTLIAEVVRRMLDTDGVYVCSSKQLQAQFLGDFDDSRVLYGKANYHCDTYGNCEDGIDAGCGADCGWRRAREEAGDAKTAVVNSALWFLTRWNRGLTVIDEFDTLESVLMGQAEIWLSARAQQRWGVEPPKKMTVEASYREWAEKTLRLLKAQRKRLKGKSPLVLAERRKLSGLIGNVELLLGDLEAGFPWVYTGGAGSERRAGETVAFKPVKVDRLGMARIWSSGKRFLLMSATVISAGVRLRDLGWDASFAEVRMSSQFPAKNRPVVVRPVASMTRAGQENGVGAVVGEVSRIVDAHDGERVLVHTVSYRLAQTVVEGLRSGSRTVVDYSDAAGRQAALERFLACPGAVLVAPSMERGVDLPGDACRVQIVLKVPLPNLGDKQVSARLYAENGQVWYAMQTAASLMQMVGRAVRSADDYAVCYILDAHFLEWRKRWGHLFPGWFARAIRVERIEPRAVRQVSPARVRW